MIVELLQRGYFSLVASKCSLTQLPSWICTVISILLPLPAACLCSVPCAAVYGYCAEQRFCCTLGAHLCLAFCIQGLSPEFAQWSNVVPLQRGQLSLQRKRLDSSLRAELSSFAPIVALCWYLVIKRSLLLKKKKGITGLVF